MGKGESKKCLLDLPEKRCRTGPLRATGEMFGISPVGFTPSKICENRDPEHGSSRVNLVLTLLVIGTMIWVGTKIFPVYFAGYQFQDSIDSESRFALTGYPKKTPDDVRDDIFQKAQELGIPAKKDYIQVEFFNGRVEIALDYAVPINLAGYQFSLQFHPHADNHI